MKFLVAITRAYPWQTAILVAALLIAGILEGASISMLLPVLSIAVGSQTGSGEIPETTAPDQGSKVERLVTQAFDFIGISPTIGVLLAAIIAVVIIKSLLMLVAKKQIGYTVARFATDLRLKLLHALLVTRWENYLNQAVGGLANAMATEANRASRAYMSGIMMTAFAIQALVYAAIAILVSWKVTLIALAAGFIIIFLLKRFVQKARKAGLRRTKLLKSLLSVMTDMLQSIKPLKAMARENLADYLLERKTTSLNKALQKEVFNKEALKAFQEPLLMIFIAVGLYVALKYLDLPLANVMILVYLSIQLLRQLNKIQERYQEMVVYESAYWSLQDTIAEVEKEQEDSTGNQIPQLNHEVRFSNVGFAYKEDWIIRNASLTFPAGKITALVGSSGSGKTTIVDLVTGLLHPQEGELFIDDLPLAQVDIKQWRRMIGYIPQETLLLHDTIRANVTLGDSELSDKDVEYALRAAGAWEFVLAMPQGMESIVGERGGKISGGQRQRIAIARALVHRPKLLILDEATSALDPDSEAEICKTMRQLRGELTLVSISHQPALVDIADQAYRIENAKVLPVPAKQTDGKNSSDDASDRGQDVKLASTT